MSCTGQRQSLKNVNTVVTSRVCVVVWWGTTSAVGCVAAPLVQSNEASGQHQHKPQHRRAAAPSHDSARASHGHAYQSRGCSQDNWFKLLWPQAWLLIWSTLGVTTSPFVVCRCTTSLISWALTCWPTYTITQTLQGVMVCSWPHCGLCGRQKRRLVLPSCESLLARPCCRRLLGPTSLEFCAHRSVGAAGGTCGLDPLKNDFQFVVS